MKIAIVGAGVSGLTAAHLLHQAHDVTVFEAGGHAGGHANTLSVHEGSRALAIDTGFIVYNERTYPLFTRLLASLGVATQSTQMSFSVTCDGCGLSYSGKGIAGLLARPSNIARPAYLRLLADVVRFNRWASTVPLASVDPGATLSDAVTRQGFSDYFSRHYLVPMTSAIWSASSVEAERFPLAPFLAFFRNHGLLQVRNQPPWRTIIGGSREYVKALIAPFGERIRLHAAVGRIRREAMGVDVQWSGGRGTFDRVVVATHSDQALAMLDAPAPAERAALEAIPYAANEAILHTDAGVLPPRRAAWAAWNYHLPACQGSSEPLRMTYYMNALQRLDSTQTYCVTLNSSKGIDPARILARIPYHHPVYAVSGIEARRRLREVSGHGGVHYCGAYLGNGFHEDGVRSAHEAAAELGVHAFERS
jgi:predicted NAD/FAD-binding protein